MERPLSSLTQLANSLQFHVFTRGWLPNKNDLQTQVHVWALMDISWLSSENSNTIYCSVLLINNDYCVVCLFF